MAKKSFKASMEAAKDNAALSFIGEAQEDTQERKSKRVNLLIKPSAIKDAKKIATMERTSVNDLINRLLEEYVASNADKIEQYNKIFGEEG